jgi:predicted permease
MNSAKSLRFYRFLLHLYPREFRAVFGEEMETSFLTSLNGHSQERGVAGVLYTWTRIIWDTLIHSISVRFRGRNADSDRTTGDGRPDRPVRNSIRPPVMDNLFYDIRYAVRSLIRTPAFVVTTVLSLTVGILVSTAIFSVANATVLRPPPHVSDPDEVVKVILEHPAYPNARFLFSYPYYQDLAEQITTLEGLAGVQPEIEYTVRVGSNAEQRMFGEMVTENYFSLLGIPMALGRGFIAEDAETGGSVAVIGYRVWQSEFNGEHSVLGQTLRVDGKPYTVVGVAPAGVSLLGEIPVDVDVWLPIPPDYRENRSAGFLYPVGRRLDGVTTAQVEAECQTIAARFAEEYPDDWLDRNGDPVRLRVMTDRESRIPFGDSVLPILSVYLIVDLLIMLIVCSNVASLLLTRALRRKAEIAVRLALGAGRGRLVSQLLTESLVLFGLAGAFSLLLMHWLTQLISRGIGPVPFAVNFTVDHRVLAFTVILTVLSGVIFGLAPALQASRPELAPALKGTDRSIRFRRFGVRNLLVLSQVAGSLVLVVLTALMVRGIRYADTIELGFDPQDVAVLSLDLSQRDYDRDSGIQFLNELTERMSGVAGVEGVAVADQVPLSGWLPRWGGLQVEGYEPAPDETIFATSNAISPGYFDVVRMPLLAGRDFDATDVRESPPVIIVNQAFVRRFWPDGEGVGRQVTLTSERQAEVIGVVRDAKYREVTEVSELHFWMPRTQAYRSQVEVHVRTRGDPAPFFATLRDQVRALDSELPIIEMRPMERVISQATLGQRLTAGVFGGVGLIALLLAVVGIYGVMAFAVAQRTREMGIRIAVGARPGRLVGMVVTESLALSAVGFGVGLVLAAAIAQLMRTMLFGISPLDPVSFGGSIALLATAAALAALMPALRAARVDPVVSLKSE